MNKRGFGKVGEKIAIHFLKEKGYLILESNYYYEHSEIDIIAMDPDKELVFIEVKTRKTSKFEYPENAVNKKKQLSMMKVANAYIEYNELSDLPARFDVISILAPNEKKQDIRHIIDAFQFDLSI